MPYVILGMDATLKALVRLLAMGGPIEWRAAFDVPPDFHDDLRHLCGIYTFRDDWESLLGESSALTLLVSGWPDDPWLQQRRREQLSRLAATDLNVVAVHPPCDVLLGHQIVAERLGRAAWQVFHPALIDSDYLRFERWCTDSETSQGARLIQLSVERRRPRCPASEVWRDLSSDLVLVERLAGPIERVGGWGGALSTGPFQLALQMETRLGTLVRWNLLESDRATAHWTAERASATATAEHQASTSRWTFRPEGDRQEQSAPSQSAGVPTIGWEQAVHAVEVMDSIEVAVRRGRNVEIVQDGYNEEAAFKSRMAVGGCLLLLFLLALLIVGSILEGFRYPFVRSGETFSGSGDSAANPGSTADSLWWRLWPVYPLLLFLALQALRWLLRPAPASAKSGVFPAKPVGKTADRTAPANAAGADRAGRKPDG
ncbi:MAG: hypothetical protein KatS3mg110_0133 [Pirellulaceae bacterium]|nr:MAG: hypothetical protein KatS3mg110_0133 [Pirellulaceae bacterium]